MIIGIDVGATAISGGLLTPQGEVLAAMESPTRQRGSALETLLGVVAELVDRARGGGFDLEGIGVGLPGLVDADKGMLVSEQNFVPELAHVPLGERLQASTGVPVFVDNDVNALALTESMFGTARGVRSFVLIAVGTGVGGGLVLDGHLVRGHTGCAGEFGHICVDVDGPRCLCGGRGCLNAWVSGKALAETASQLLAEGRSSSLLALAGGEPQKVTAALIFEAAERGDPLAGELVANACRALGAGIGGVVNMIDPELIVVTGGVAASLARFAPRILEAVSAHALAHALARTRVRFVPADKRRTVLGGAALVLYELGRRGERTAVRR